MTVDLLGAGLNELEEFCLLRDIPRYRARQMAEGLYRHNIRSWQELVVLPRETRDMLDVEAPLTVPTVVDTSSTGDGTQKYLLELADGQKVETVRLTYTYGKVACVSSQAGCRQGCVFCASHVGGCIRDLSAGEMLAQVQALRREAPAEALAGVVVMGTGEPLENYAATVRFLRLLQAPYSLEMSPRRITVSTCGLIPGILRLADEGLPVTLAVSLHAATDELRSQLVPANRRYPIKKLLEACATYFQRTGRRVSFEYVLLEGINDSLEEAKRLARLLPAEWGHINLIPVNPVSGTPFRPPSREKVAQFAGLLRREGIGVTVRRSLGRTIGAACGQLRAYRFQKGD